ncbi:hypothetical protein PMZ80_007810 [Knufia obscura]|uniref:AB hydrolase-1 domain-containing protein n=2 Tax=Knufia TaxID=430999 RepID=A0AAN8EFA2_9EURO|nr:hypothetical protein PMZ80_007810 [Knufia obscura]KAK5954344.1 hypothetical protein OHC33_004917 [Knufia fluminis]
MVAQKPTIVLIPGAWHYPQCFDLLVDRLHELNYETRQIKLKSVVTPDESRTRSHQEDVVVTREAIDPLIEQGKEVIVLGHSYGGRVVSEAALGLGKQGSKQGGVVHLIYCCAFVIENGESIFSLMQNPTLAAGLPSHFAAVEEDGVTLRVLEEHAIDTFYHDLEPVLAQKMVDNLGLHSFLAFKSSQEHCAHREIPTTYILCEQDRAIFPFVQQHMIEAGDIKDVVKLNASHSPFLSMPDEVVGIINRIAEQKENAQS